MQVSTGLMDATSNEGFAADSALAVSAATVSNAVKKMKKVDFPKRFKINPWIINTSAINLVLRRNFRAIDDEIFFRSFTRLQLQPELFLDCGED
jgi:hypothetical protein